ncbi:hypothetical protein B9Z55_021138 [Caenorhabditis nigoni]|uniref:F-box domain-containing protein n=1 Tax=Caenorhabditis nigoni TaxID=1611254 RepID=A0A2G5TQR4_9PELO|nr:hypothetical protein B9Z55_021138 [Caenorhabditis nigoni]
MCFSKSVFTDVVTIRTFILHDCRQKVPIFEGFKNLSEVVGHENIDFPEYEFWYYRFLSGNVSLEDDRSSFPEPLTLLDLPMDALVEIIDHLDVNNRMNVRKVSKSLRDVIDSQKIDHSYISLDIGETSIRFKLNDSVFEYSEDLLGDFRWEPYENAENIKILDKDFRKMAMKDLENSLKSAKNVRFFEVVFNGSSPKNVFDMFLEVMENTKFDVERIIIQEERNEEALKILSFFKPGKLEDICSESVGRDANLDNLLEMEQFKKAKKVDLEQYGTLDFSLIDRFFSFEKFYVRLEDIRRDDVILVQNVLEKLSNDRDWTFYSDNLVRVEVEQAIDHSRVMEHSDDDWKIFYKTKVPNSEHFIDFRFVEWACLTMRKYK